MNLSTLSYFTQFGRVFPLAKNSKKPMKTWEWRTMNTDDLEVINDWLDKYPDANWALVPVRALVVDVDCKDGAQGPASIEAAGGLKKTFVVRTPSGGSHHYYHVPGGSIRFVTKNQWLRGVDIRYGDGGYVVMPFSTTQQGRYEIEVDLDDLQSEDSSHGPNGSSLPFVPEWIKAKIVQEEPPVTNSNTPITPTVEYIKCDTWAEVRDSVKFMFFRNQKNAMIWNHKSISSMKDATQSGFENQLAIRLMNVGATDEEIAIMYRVWCGKHKLKRKDRFYTHIIPDARLATASYIAAWKSQQPVRRKHGTTTIQILEAITNGLNQPMAICEATGLKGSTVRMQLKRLTDAEKLVRMPSGYAIPYECIPVVESVAA
jgi:hypothetical protein